MGTSSSTVSPWCRRTAARVRKQGKLGKRVVPDGASGGGKHGWASHCLPGARWVGVVTSAASESIQNVAVLNKVIALAIELQVGRNATELFCSIIPIVLRSSAVVGAMLQQ